MEERDVVTITLKGEETKKYFLDRIGRSFGVTFKKIPKEPIILEEKGGKKNSVEMFSDLLELKLIKDVSFETSCCDEEEIEVPKVSKEVKIDQISLITDNIEENDASVEKKNVSKHRGQNRREIINYLSKKGEETFSSRDVANELNISYITTKRILEKLVKEKYLEKQIISARKTKYFVILQNNERKNNLEEQKRKNENIDESVKNEKASQKVDNDWAEKRKEEAISKQTEKTKKILQLFCKGKNYEGVLKKIFRVDWFETCRLSSELSSEENNVLPEILITLENEAITRSEDEAGKFEVDVVWRIYALNRLGLEVKRNVARSQEVINDLLEKGMIYDSGNMEYELIS